MSELEYRNIISVYTRRQAIADGLLVDITEVAKACGFSLPTVATSDVMSQQFRTEAGLPALLWRFHAKVVAGQSEENELCILTDLDREGAERTLWLHLGTGDDGEPVLTLLYPENW